jgi:hypothetical protein
VNGALTQREAIELWENCLLTGGSKMPSKQLFNAAKEIADFAGDYDCDCSKMEDLFKAFEQRHSGTAVEAAVAAEVAAVAPAERERIVGPAILAPAVVAAAREVIVID